MPFALKWKHCPEACAGRPSTVSTAPGHARDAGERIQNKAQQVREVVGGQLEERPVTALLSAFGIGMVLGALLGRKV